MTSTERSSFKIGRVEIISRTDLDSLDQQKKSSGEFCPSQHSVIRDSSFFSELKYGSNQGACNWFVHGLHAVCKCSTCLLTLKIVRIINEQNFVYCHFAMIKENIDEYENRVQTV
ncbi:hypothetical protein QQG55_24905 [Brugia pahangi]